MNTLVDALFSKILGFQNLYLVFKRIEKNFKLFKKYIYCLVFQISVLLNFSFFFFFFFFFFLLDDSLGYMLKKVFVCV